jgi:hypothetical protein
MYVFKCSTLYTLAARANVLKLSYACYPPRPPFLPLQQSAGLAKPVKRFYKLYTNAVNLSYVNIAS